MNREKINSLMLDWYTGRCSLSRCLDEIESEFKRERGEVDGKPEIPESVKGYLELLQKRANWQVPATVDEHEIANWILANLRDEVKTKKEGES